MELEEELLLRVMQVSAHCSCESMQAGPGAQVLEPLIVTQQYLSKSMELELEEDPLQIALHCGSEAEHEGPVRQVFWPFTVTQQ